VCEYEEVLPQHRHTMGLTTTDITDFLDFLCTKANWHEIFFLWRPMLTDPKKDEMLLEPAVKARCQYIVTYNTRNFRGAPQFGIAVVTLKAFLEILERLSWHSQSQPPRVTLQTRVQTSPTGWDLP
jgi:predicted nucleic acid-binding protein